MQDTLTIVGGGLAGLAAAEAASRAGMRVELFEARDRLGGRAGSIRDPRSGQWFDACQHLALGCCTELSDFLRRLGLEDLFHYDRRLHFFSPEGRQYDLAAAGWLPAPLHLVPALMRLGYLSWSDRLGIIRAMAALTRRQGSNASGETVAAWLARHGQSAAAIEGFWSPILVSALSDTLERLSLDAARQVIREGFLASRRAYELCLPRLPLAEVWAGAAAALQARGVEVRLCARVKQVEGDRHGVRSIELADGSRIEPQRTVLAVPWRQVPRLVAPPLVEALPELEAIGRIETASIAAVNLWFDRPITPLPHAVLLGRTAQWLFRPPWQSSQGEHYYQIVISAAQTLPAWPKEELLARVLEDLRAVWPETAEAQLVQSRVVTQRAAVFSCTPGADSLRPAQRSSVPGLCWAGDWTATGWPGTMEGAVRSGRMAARACLTV